MVEALEDLLGGMSKRDVNAFGEILARILARGADPDAEAWADAEGFEFYED